MKAAIFCLLAVVMLGGCGIEGAIKRNDDRYMRPGAQDSQLTGVNDTYHFKFLDKYRITHEWPRTSNCGYRKEPTLNVEDGYRGEFWAVCDIYEEGGKTWQRFKGMKPFDFDHFVRSVNYASKERGREGEVMEVGFKAVCGEVWQATSHILNLRLYKRDLASWRAMLTEDNPKGRWSERHVGANVWLTQETAEQDFKPRQLNGSGGPFQTWLLPIGDTGYTMAMHLGASQESLQYTDAHSRFQAIFRHLIESMKIEPLNADQPDNFPSRKPAP